MKGIVIVKNILKQVEDIASTTAGNIVMIDSNGNWIYNNKNKDKEWSFMYEETKNISFKNEFPNEFDVIKENNKLLFLYIFAISIILSILFTINKISNEEVKYFSEYDTMTGTFNGRVGFEKLTKMYMNIKNNSGILSICFIDINGLKQVNDNLGHLPK